MPSMLKSVIMWLPFLTLFFLPLSSFVPIVKASGLSQATEYRAVDNAGNNKRITTMGGPAGKQLRRLSTYPGFSASSSFTITRVNAPNPRALSNAIAANAANVPNNRHINDAFTIFGQIMDHDFSLTPTGSEAAVIPIPECDPVFDNSCTGSKSIPFSRSQRDSNGMVTNNITPFLDMSFVYGESDVICSLLRSFAGGMLLLKSNTKFGDLLPVEGVDVTLPSGRGMAAGSPGTVKKLFVAGDRRANENPLLQCLQTIFAREHNRLAKELAAAKPIWNDETLFQEARRRNIAQFQNIVYNEYLPLLFGADLIPAWGYSDSVDPQVDVTFTTAAMRYGHSEINSVIARLGPDLMAVPAGPVLFRDAFFNTNSLLEEGIEPMVRGMVYSVQQAVDNYIRDDVRNFIWGGNGTVGADLFAWNIQRGRDHGLCTLNACRESLGLPRYTSFSQITTNTTLASTIASIYGNNIDLIDMYAGGLCETRYRNGNLGSSFEAIIVEQFTRFRNADRFYFETTDSALAFTAAELEAIKATRLSHVVARNTNFQPPEAMFYKPITASDSPFSAADLSQIQWEEHVAQPMNGFYLGWNISESGTSVSFRIAGQTKGWVAIGFGAEEAKLGMNNMDTVIGYVTDSGTASVKDYYVKSRVAPTEDATQNLKDVSAGETASGMTWFTFSRDVKTSDTVTDNPILNSVQSIYWAMGEFDSIVHHGVFRGALGLNLLDLDSNQRVGTAGSATSGSLTIHPQYSFSWELQATEIEITAKVDCSACWVGFGISKGPSMAGADLAIVTFSDQKAGTLTDAYSTGNTFPVFDTEKSDGSNNLKLLKATQTATESSFTFTRTLAAVDSAYDNPIDLGAYGSHVIVAWGSSNTLGYHGPSHHAHSIVYFDSSVQLGSCGAGEGTPAAAKYAVHGALLAFSWMFLASLGILAQEYGRSTKYGKVIHMALMFSAALCTICGFAYLAVGNFIIIVAHAYLGFAVLILVCVQAFLGILINAFPLVKVLRKIHKCVGYCIWVAAQANIILALDLLGAPVFFYLFHVVWILGVLSAIIISKTCRNEDGELVITAKKVSPN